MNIAVPEQQPAKLLLDPYMDWIRREGIPVTEDFGIDLLKIPTAPWPRVGVKGGAADSRLAG